MPFFGLRSFPTPIIRPMAPFFIATGITTFLVVKAQNAMSAADVFANDPKNPHLGKIAAAKAHAH